jgi:hypothetical protein
MPGSFLARSSICGPCSVEVLFVSCRKVYSTGQPGPVAQDLYKTLTDLQTGRSQDTLGWTVQLS